MEIVVIDDAQRAAQRAADEVAALVRDRPRPVLGTATGSSPLPLYAELARRCSAGRLSLAQVQAFMLDEYVGLPAGHPQRYATFMENNLRAPTDMAPGSIHGPDALAPDLEQACRDYEDLMGQAGYCDLQILGIGTDGHIGFNEPGGPLDSRTHVGTLAEQTRRDNARFFDGDVNAVPTHCLTQGLATIMEARRLMLIATGAGKAEAVAHLVQGEISPAWPASVMQRHPSVLILLDTAAASRLAPGTVLSGA